MSEHFSGPFPRAALVGAATLIVGSIIAVTAGRYKDIGVTHMPTASIVTTRNLRFEDRDDGAVVVFDVDAQRQIERFAPGTNGFVRGVMRGLARGRRAEGIGSEPPFRLNRWSDGRMSLDDPSTGTKINLEVFGPTNAAPFAHLMSAGTTDRSGT